MLTLNQLVFHTFGYYFDLRRIPRIATGREHHWSMEKQTKNCGSSVSSSRQSFANFRHLGTLTNTNTNACKYKYNKYKALVCFLLLPSCTGCMHHGHCGAWSNEKLIGVAQWAKKESTFLFWFSRNISFFPGRPLWKRIQVDTKNIYWKPILWTSKSKTWKTQFLSEIKPALHVRFRHQPNVWTEREDQLIFSFRQRKYVEDVLAEKLLTSNS